MAKSNIDKLMELKQLYEQGILTKEEMEVEKHRILNNSTSKKPERSVQDPEPRIEPVIFPASQVVEEDSIYEEDEEQSFFDKYKAYIIGGIASVLVIAGIVFVPKIISHSNDSNGFNDIPISDVSSAEIDKTLALKGKIDNTIGFSMQLKCTGNDVNGAEHYDSQESEAKVIIKGTIAEGYMLLHEYDNGLKCGKFEGSFNNVTFTGTFTNSKGKAMPFTARVLSEEDITKEKNAMIKRIDDFYKEQQKKRNLSLERFLRNDDIKNLIIDNYNTDYYNAVMDLIKQNGYIGNVEVTSNGTYKGHANVCQRMTGVDPYDDWAVDFSYNPNSNQLELKATVFDIPLKNDGSIDNEGIEKEIERLTAESREKEQKEIKEIESQAISIETIIDAYKNNIDGRADNMYYYQEKIYQFYLNKIRKSTGSFEYVMEGSGSSHGDIADILVYTDDSRLANLNFPVKLCFRGALVSISRPEYGDWYIYHFVCTEALTYQNQ